MMEASLTAQNTTTDTATYYAQRATEYDAVYAKPERQTDLRVIEASLTDAFSGHRVLEVAAGTGYWTQFYADAATSVVATDLNEATLDVARHRRAWSNVRFVVADAFALDLVEGTFDAALAGFLWSHLDVGDLDRFLRCVAERLPAGSPVLFLDNRYVEESNHPITRIDEAGNTFQARHLTDGSAWEVRKNFPDADVITAHLAAVCEDIEVTEYEYFWAARAQTRTTPPQPLRPTHSPSGGTVTCRQSVK